MKTSLSRRTVLRHLAGAAAALPLINVIKYPEAYAAGSVAPLRLVTVWAPFQVPEILFHPLNAAGAQATSGTDFSLSFANSATAALDRYKSKLIMFRGLKYGMALNSHSSNATVFTGSASGNLADGQMPTTTGSSIEQYLFSRMGQKGSLTPMIGGLLSYMFADHLKDNTISFQGGQAQGMVGNPASLFKTYFQNYKPPTMGGTPDAGMPDQTAAHLAARRQQVFAVSQKGLTAFLNQVPSASNSGQILSQHQTALQALSASVATAPMMTDGGSMTPAQLMACTPPVASAIPNDGTSDNGNTNIALASSDGAAFGTLITEAFACDIVRFASLKMSSPSFDVGANVMPGVPAGEFHARVSHSNGSTSGNPGDALDIQLALFKNFWHSQVAGLMDQLQATADPYNASQSLLDNTVVLIGSEGPVQANHGDGHGNGDGDQMFIVAGGGAGTGFKLGQLIDTRATGNINHNVLLTNLINAFESNQAAFDPTFTPKILSQFGDYAFTQSATGWLK